jgi:hypothetical protein
MPAKRELSMRQLRRLLRLHHGGAPSVRAECRDDSLAQYPFYDLRVQCLWGGRRNPAVWTIGQVDGRHSHRIEYRKKVSEP